MASLLVIDISCPSLVSHARACADTACPILEGTQRPELQPTSATYDPTETRGELSFVHHIGARDDTARGQWCDSTQGPTSSVDPSGFCAAPDPALRATAGRAPAAFGGVRLHQHLRNTGDLCVTRATVC